MADKKKEYQKNSSTRKSMLSEENKKMAVALGVPLASAAFGLGVVTAHDRAMDKLKEEKLKKLSKFQNRTKLKGISSAKIIKLP